MVLQCEYTNITKSVLIIIKKIWDSLLKLWTRNFGMSSLVYLLVNSKLKENIYNKNIRYVFFSQFYGDEWFEMHVSTTSALLS